MLNNEGDTHLGAPVLICTSPGTTFNLAERTRREVPASISKLSYFNSHP